MGSISELGNARLAMMGFRVEGWGLERRNHLVLQRTTRLYRYKNTLPATSCAGAMGVVHRGMNVSRPAGARLTILEPAT